VAADQSEDTNLEPVEEREVDDHQQLTALIVYEVRREGKKELDRPIGSLWWSGLTAGVGMGSSLAAQGAPHAGLPASSLYAPKYCHIFC
jgi:hypothetical protein